MQSARVRQYYQGPGVAYPRGSRSVAGDCPPRSCAKVKHRGVQATGGLPGPAVRRSDRGHRLVDTVGQSEQRMSSRELGTLLARPEPWVSTLRITVCHFAGIMDGRALLGGDGPALVHRHCASSESPERCIDGGPQWRVVRPSSVARPVHVLDPEAISRWSSSPSSEGSRGKAGCRALLLLCLQYPRIAPPQM